MDTRKGAKFAERLVQVHHLHLEQNEAPHRTQTNKNKDQEKRFRKKTPGIRVPKTSLRIRAKEDLQCNCVETVMWRASGSMENLPKEQSTKRQLGKFKESSIHGGRGE